MTTTAGTPSKAALARENERLRAEIEALRAHALRPLTKTAATYLRVLAEVYGPQAWATPLCVHIVATATAPDYRLLSPSSSAIASLAVRGCIERVGTVLRITPEGMAEEARQVDRS